MNIRCHAIVLQPIAFTYLQQLKVFILLRHFLNDLIPNEWIDDEIEDYEGMTLEIPFSPLAEVCPQSVVCLTTNSRSKVRCA